MGIYTQFIDLSDTTDVQYECKIQREITRLKCKLIRVEKCLQVVATIHDNLPVINYELLQETYEYVIAELRSMNFRYKFDLHNHNSLIRDIKLTQSRSKQWSMELAMLEQEQASYHSKQQGEKVDRVYFTQALVRIGKWYGGGVLKPEAITVSEYCQLKNDYVEHVNQSNKVNGKR